MNSTKIITKCSELNSLCTQVRALVANKQYKQCENLICNAMERYPHAPQPHNLFGVLLEKEGNHTEAMRHFRAAWALDATYAPAGENLKTYGTFYSSGRCAFDESDCTSVQSQRCVIAYDACGMNCVARRG